MSYEGYLIKFGNYIFPLNKIALKTYKAKYNTNDVDSYMDASDGLHRFVSDHKRLKAELNTIPGLTNTEFDLIMGNLRANMLSEKEKSGNASVFIPEYGYYVSQKVYIPDPEITIKKISGTQVVYESIRLAFIGY